MPAKDNVLIAPADGTLGVLIPGIGAVSTTFMAGVEAVKRGLGAPVGSLTQLSTIRLGKRTDGRSPHDQGFRAPGGSERSGLRRLGHLRRHRLRSRGQRQGSGKDLLAQVEGAAVGHPSDEGRVRFGIHPPHQRSQRQDRGHQDGQGGNADGRHRSNSARRTIAPAW